MRIVVVPGVRTDEIVMGFSPTGFTLHHSGFFEVDFQLGFVGSTLECSSSPGADWAAGSLGGPQAPCAIRTGRKVIAMGRTGGQKYFRLIGLILAAIPRMSCDGSGDYRPDGITMRQILSRLAFHG
jgi:hypothetical protein